MNVSKNLQDSLRISLVIPVYNEASQIAACLESIARQTVKPFEVIVVDNNSTDNTVEIASSYAFVRILNAKQQGVVHARNRGFNAACGEIIGRIDADSRIAPDWVETVVGIFSAQPKLQAISGSLHYYDIACQRLIDGIDARVRSWLGRRTAGAVYLLGANMAIRKQGWNRVNMSTCSHGGIHEDLDLAAHLALSGLPVAYAPELISGVSGRRADTNFIDFVRYLLSMPNTYRAHRLWQRVHFYPVMLLVALCYLFLRIIYRGYDTSNEAFRWRQVFAAQEAQRSNPIY
jgi:glycosyltransferase involved in cell wall biosynthesis